MCIGTVCGPASCRRKIDRNEEDFGKRNELISNQVENTKFVGVNVQDNTHIIASCQIESVGSQHEQGQDEEKVVGAHRIEVGKQLYDEGGENSHKSGVRREKFSGRGGDEGLFPGRSLHLAI